MAECAKSIAEGKAEMEHELLSAEQAQAQADELAEREMQKKLDEINAMLPLAEERARHLGGTFQLDSKPGRGTLLRVTLPLSAAIGGALYFDRSGPSVVMMLTATKPYGSWKNANA